MSVIGEHRQIGAFERTFSAKASYLDTTLFLVITQQSRASVFFKQLMTGDIRVLGLTAHSFGVCRHPPASGSWEWRNHEIALVELIPFLFTPDDYFQGFTMAFLMDGRCFVFTRYFSHISILFSWSPVGLVYY